MTDSAITTTDVGHDMDPVDAETAMQDDPEDRSAAAYAQVKLNETDNSS